MSPLFAIALDLSPAAWVATIISVTGFILMFGIASAKGDFKGLAESTLQNDNQIRNKNKKENK